MRKTSKASQSKSKPNKTKKREHSDRVTAKKVTDELFPRQWVGDLALLRRVINRIREINGPRMDLFAHKGRQAEHVKLATISTSIEIAQLAKVEKPEYVLWLVQHQYRKQLREEFLQHLTQAGEEGADLVCFNELAYPTPLDEKGDNVFKNKVKKIVSQYELSLIAGSYHDATRFYNLSPVIAHSDKQKGTHAIAHAKMTSAVRAFELIRIPPNRQIRYYQTKHGFFAVLICIDIYDPSLIFRLIMKNHLYSGEEKIDFVFVPSFTANDAPKLAKACQDLSYASATLVVYVNCSADTPRHAAYLAGEEVTESNTGIACEVKKLSPNLQLLSIAQDEYRRLRTQVSDGYSQVFDYLIGQKDGIRTNIKI